MRANPGGEIAPEDVVGRDRLIRQLWHTLERQSVILAAERRMGKSCVAKKMVAEKPYTAVVIYRDIENIDTPIGFVERIYQDVTPHLSTLKRGQNRFQSLMQQLSGAQITGIGKFPDVVARHWKALLEEMLSDIAENYEGTVIFFWDEFPLMLQKIVQTSGESEAMEILDTLRAARQTHNNVRMLYTGSIGLHHVTTSLRDSGHCNDATNDMRTVEVDPLAAADARELALALLKGEGLKSPQLATVAEVIAGITDGIAFYIHYVISEMKFLGDDASVELAKDIVAKVLVEPNDPWHLQHYRSRLNEYFDASQLEIVLFILDEIAVENTALSLDMLRTRLAANIEAMNGQAAHQIVSGDSELFRRILLQLSRDHYLKQSEIDGAFSYRFPVIRRWWMLSRGLI